MFSFFIYIHLYNYKREVRLPVFLSMCILNTPLLSNTYIRRLICSHRARKELSVFMDHTYFIRSSREADHTKRCIYALAKCHWNHQIGWPSARIKKKYTKLCCPSFEIVMFIDASVFLVRRLYLTLSNTARILSSTTVP